MEYSAEIIELVRILQQQANRSVEIDCESAQSLVEFIQFLLELGREANDE